MGETNVDDYQTFALESIERLKLIRVGAVASIVDLMRNAEQIGGAAASLAYRREDPQLAINEKTALGIRSNSKMSRKAFQELTPEGRKRPLEAHLVSQLRASSNLSRYHYIVQTREMNLNGLYYCVPENENCHECKQLEGLRVRTCDASPFPPKTCENDWCRAVLCVDIGSRTSH